MQPLSRLFLLGTFLIFSGGVSLAACGSHTVVRGDTLRELALQYLGAEDAADQIYAINADAIGADPDTIEVATVLNIPCPEADTPEPAAPRAASVIARPLPPFQILTGGPFAPFTGDNLREGGLITDLLRTALGQVASTPGFEISFVNDRGAHLGIILPRGGFDLAYPWVYPDCKARALTEQEALLCADFIASEPIYEYIVEFYVRADNRFAGAELPNDLSGARVCRPAGYPLDDLVNYGLLPDRIELITGNTPATCLTLLDRGEVDIASMDAGLTRAMVRRIDVENPLLVLDAMTTIRTLHVIAPKAADEAPQRIKLINEGLRRISESGQWYEIVQRHKDIPLN